ncbi:MAG: MarR family winged helix-turn-helix transcriptional regulator [Rhodothalassiaceae bacterium]
MPEDRAVLRLAEFLPYRLSVLSNTVSRAIAESYEQRFNLSLPEWRVMAVLAETPDISAGEVAQRTAMDKVAVSRAVKRLLKAGRIERHTAPTDRRRSVLALSYDGESIYRQIVPLAQAYEDRLLAVLSEADKAALKAILDRLQGAPGPASLR